jgi:hypothetical protein
MSMKNSSGTIGNRTRDIPACSAVSQPTAPPAACPVFTMYSVSTQFLFLKQSATYFGQIYSQHQADRKNKKGLAISLMLALY